VIGKLNRKSSKQENPHRSHISGFWLGHSLSHAIHTLCAMLLIRLWILHVDRGEPVPPTLLGLTPNQLYNRPFGWNSICPTWRWLICFNRVITNEQFKPWRNSYSSKILRMAIDVGVTSEEACSYNPLRPISKRQEALTKLRYAWQHFGKRTFGPHDAHARTKPLTK